MSAATDVFARYRLSSNICIAAGLLTAVSANAAEALDPLSTFKSEMRCYRRDYSAEHLAHHPGQTVKSVLLAYEGGALLTLVLTPRTGPTKQISAGCSWTPAGADIDTSGRKMIPDFKGSAAYECMVTVGGSAAEGGYLLLAPAHDMKSVTVFIQSPITTDDVVFDDNRAYNLNLAPEDVTFKLPRVDPKPCASFKAKMG